MHSKRFRLNKINRENSPAGEASETCGLTFPARVLGIDAALRSTGYGLVEVLNPEELRVLDCGVIKTAAQAPLSECLRRLQGGIRQLLDSMRPAVATLESGFFHRNVKTAMVLGAARGVVIATIAEQHIPVFEYAPRQIKQAICGHGNAGKHQVALMTARLLGLELEAVDNDATDALGAALCHISLATRHEGIFLPLPS